jgi:sorbitol-specific phosphotransferase system component IIC
MSESQSLANIKRWQDTALPAFFVHLATSTVGSIVVGFVAAIIPAALAAAFTTNTSGGNWIDHLAEQCFLNAAGEPYFLFPVLSGFTLGTLSYR